MTDFTGLFDAFTRPKLVLYAYALSCGEQDCAKLASVLGIAPVPETGEEAWERYMLTPPYAPLSALTDEYKLDEFLCFALSLAFACALDETVSAVLSALGGGLTPVFTARLFAASAEEAAELRARWVINRDVIELLFDDTDTLKLSDTIMRFLLGAGGDMTLPRHLDRLATRVAAVFTWDGLVLPDTQKSLLRHICDRARYERVVYGEWGYGKVMPYGRGIRALFSGPPGTGKTMAAQVIAGELGMELYRVDISAAVSKYIGETEKNLDAVFREAAKSGGILFFDEADAIFGKRGEQKDSHDKYANMQTSFLLQRVEEYDGIVLLATNFASNLDTAFMRRIQVHVDFPAPDENARLVIWRNLLTGFNITYADIDFEFLAKNFQLTGSEIKNTVITAAFFAASENSAITMPLIIKALEMEYGKTGKILSKRDLGEYADG